MRLTRMRVLREHRRVSAGLGTLLAAGLVVSVASVARAEEPPTSMELMEKCGNGTDVCDFHIGGPARTYWQTADLAGQTANCTDKPQEALISWEKTTSSTNSVGWSMKVTAGATKAFQAGFKVAYSHEWTSSTTDRDTTKITIPAGSMGRVFHAREMEEVSGQYELHFGSRFHDHYYWYLPMTVTSPRSGGNDAVTTRSDPLTDSERAAYCA